MGWSVRNTPVGLSLPKDPDGLISLLFAVKVTDVSLPENPLSPENPLVPENPLYPLSPENPENVPENPDVPE
jgi:hypothetical protein